MEKSQTNTSSFTWGMGLGDLESFRTVPQCCKKLSFPAIFAEFLQRQSTAEEDFLEIKEPYLYPGFREVKWQK